MKGRLLALGLVAMFGLILIGSVAAGVGEYPEGSICMWNPPPPVPGRTPWWDDPCE